MFGSLLAFSVLGKGFFAELLKDTHRHGSPPAGDRPPSAG